MQNTNTEEPALFSIMNSVDGYKNKDIPQDKNRLHVSAQNTGTADQRELFKQTVKFISTGKYNDEKNNEIQADNCVFLHGGGHPGFQAVMKGVNMILVNDSNKHSHGHLDFSLKKEFEDSSLLTPGEQEAMKLRPIVLLGTQLTSATGSCFNGTYLTERFFTKNNGEMMKSLDNYIKENVNSEYAYKYDPIKLQIDAWRKEGKFVAQVAYPKWNDDGTEAWYKPIAIDLIGWGHAVDYVKDTQSRKFIDNFIKRYKNKYSKEPTIGVLKLPLRDYVDFFSTSVDNGKLQTNTASAMAAISLERRGFGTADVDELYNKNFNFNKLLDKIIKTNNLKITVEQLNKILEDRHQAKDKPDKMFVLAQESEELLKSIQAVQSKDKHGIWCKIKHWFKKNFCFPTKNTTKNTIADNNLFEVSNYMNNGFPPLY